MKHFIIILLLCVFCAGCGHHFPLGKVEGTVSYDGKPLEKWTIIFSISGKREASGQIENGVIHNVTTFTDGDDSDYCETEKRSCSGFGNTFTGQTRRRNTV